MHHHGLQRPALWITELDSLGAGGWQKGGRHAGGFPNDVPFMQPLGHPGGMMDAHHLPMPPQQLSMDESHAPAFHGHYQVDKMGSTYLTQIIRLLPESADHSSICVIGRACMEMGPPCQTPDIWGSLRSSWAAGPTAAEGIAGAAAGAAEVLSGGPQCLSLPCSSATAGARPPLWRASLPMCRFQKAWQAKRCVLELFLHYTASCCS